MRLPSSPQSGRLSEEDERGDEFYGEGVARPIVIERKALTLTTRRLRGLGENLEI